jgi:hypothetical protein
MIMLKATNDERGTVAGLGSLAQDLDDHFEDGSFVSYHIFADINLLTMQHSRAIICTFAASRDKSHEY